MSTNETQTCEDCGKEVSPLEVFPAATKDGVRCVNCYSGSAEDRNYGFDQMKQTFGGGK